MKKILYCIAFLSFLPGSFFSQSVFYVTNNGELIKTNPTTCSSTSIANTGLDFQDIAFHSNGKLYGLDDGDIYTIDTITGALTLIMTIPGNPNFPWSSLTGGPNGKLYSVQGSALYEIDPIALTFSNLGNVTCTSAGDLTFIDGQLYLTCDNNDLLRINIDLPFLSTVVGNMAIIGDPFGLINTYVNCTNVPYVISQNGNVYSLDHNTATVSFLCFLSPTGNIYGAAVVNESLFRDPNDILGPDRFICPGQTVALDAQRINATYLWQDNSTDSVFHTNQVGTYWVEVYSNCDTIRDTITIFNSPQQISGLGNDTTICQGQSLLLSLNYSGASYSWQDNSSYSSFNVTQSGTYWVDIQFSCDTIRDSIKVEIRQPIAFSLGPDIALCEGGGFLLLNANTPSITSYLWQDNSTTPAIQINTPGIYWVNASNNCNAYSDTIVVTKKTCESELLIPNVFSPNGDGSNDKFIPVYQKNIFNPELFIYNRWGQLLYQTSDLTIGWDGKYKGKLCSEGTYYWIVTHGFDGENKLNGVVNIFH